MRRPGATARGVIVTAGGRNIVRVEDFHVEGGELVAVIGPSGTGKTTFLRALSRIRRRGIRVSGSITVEGSVSIIPQEPWYGVSSPYVATELSFSGLRIEELTSLLRELELEGKEFKATTSLSAGEAMRLAIASAMASGSEVLLVDEFSSYLDSESRDASIELLRREADSGRAVVVVDHSPWIVDYADRVYVSIGSTIREYSAKDVMEAYRDVYKLLEELAPPKPLDDIVLEARDLKYRYPDSQEILKGVDVELAKGSIAVVRGRSGSGKSTLLKVLAGVYKPSGGKLSCMCKRLLVPENPLFFLSEPTVAEELGGDKALASMVGLEKAFSNPIGVISSGERRRLALASAFKRGGEVILVDEPTVGLDPWSAAKILRLLVELALSGVGIVVASHSEVLARIANRVIEM